MCAKREQEDEPKKSKANVAPEVWVIFAMPSSWLQPFEYVIPGSVLSTMIVLLANDTLGEGIYAIKSKRNG